LQVTRLGETAAFVGVTIATFSGVSVLARPLMGSAVDRRGSGPVLAVGATLLAVASLAYLVPSLVVLLIGRAAHGIGWAAVNTAGTTLVADVVPAKRRGEAMGWLSLSKALAAVGAPALGLALLAAAGFDATFLAAAGVAALALGVAAWLSQRVAAPRRSAGRGSLLAVETSSIVPATILALLYAGNPLLQSFVVLLAKERAIEGLAVYFFASGVVLVLVQPLARLSDRIGRGPNMATGLVMVAVALGLAIVAHDLPTLILAGVFWSAGAGLVEPTATALAVDLAPPERRGAAMATYTAAFQVGNAGGALLWGYLIAAVGFEAAFGGAIACVIAALVILRTVWPRLRSGTPTVDRELTT
jgi:predicted MFS family arabinose efflux permease